MYAQHWLRSNHLYSNIIMNWQSSPALSTNSYPIWPVQNIHVYGIQSAIITVTGALLVVIVSSQYCFIITTDVFSIFITLQLLNDLSFVWLYIRPTFCLLGLQTNKQILKVCRFSRNDTAKDLWCIFIGTKLSYRRFTGFKAFRAYTL